MTEQERQVYHDALIVICEIGSMVTTEEGDKEKTEEEIGLEISEIVGMAHDNMILSARNVLDTHREFLVATEILESGS